MSALCQKQTFCDYQHSGRIPLPVGSCLRNYTATRLRSCATILHDNGGPKYATGRGELPVVNYINTKWRCRDGVVIVRVLHREELSERGWDRHDCNQRPNQNVPSRTRVAAGAFGFLT